MAANVNHVVKHPVHQLVLGRRRKRAGSVAPQRDRAVANGLGWKQM
jgi:hypothetical protein